MATETIIRTLKWWLSTGRVSEEYIEGLVTTGKLTQAECDEILGVI